MAPGPAGLVVRSCDHPDTDPLTQFDRLIPMVAFELEGQVARTGEFDNVARGHGAQGHGLPTLAVNEMGGWQRLPWQVSGAGAPGRQL